MRSFFKTRFQSFRYAFAGWWYVVRSQQNAWIHVLASFTVLLLGIWLNLLPRDWAVIILSVALVWTAEFINTALEAVVDLASPEQHELARTGKDVGAAAVLIAAGSSVLIGILILGPPLWERMQSYLSP
jgi:diacylglycerol kinase (ATP)